MRDSRQQAGFAILMVVFMAALVAIALTAVLPSVLMEGTREREEELLFRGQQYQRAIALYHRKFNRLPMKVEDLLHTNNRSFLRRPWPDPMTEDGEWRLIRQGPGGRLVGSLKQKPAGPGLMRAPTGLKSDASTFPLVGVASQSTAHSYNVFDQEESYDRWEFVYDPTKLKDKTKGKGNQQKSPLGRKREPRKRR